MYNDEAKASMYYIFYSIETFALAPNLIGNVLYDTPMQIGEKTKLQAILKASGVENWIKIERRI